MTHTAETSLTSESNPIEREWRSRTYVGRLGVACLFWTLCLTLTAAGHRLYKATVQLDRIVSSERYKEAGTSLVWVGYGSVANAVERSMPETGQIDIAKLTVLPNSVFLLCAVAGYTMLGGMLIWSGRWISNNGIQSLSGVFAGHFLWLGAIEFGLAAAGRRLGLAGSIDVVEGRVVGTHGGGVLIQLSVVFLVPVLVGLMFHESNRCVLFQWFRGRLPILRTPSPNGRVENYAARTAIQYFMTVWFCYVSVLWMADSRLGDVGQYALLSTLILISAATPYMVWRTMRQPSDAQALRYSVSGAVVTWTAIEIAAAMQFFHEPWLSNSVESGVVWLGLPILLTLMTARILFRTRIWLANTGVVASITLVVLIGTPGCGRPDQKLPMPAAEIAQRLREYDAQIQAPQPEAQDGLLHALHSSDPAMRAQAAVAFGKSRQVNSAIKKRLQSMATNDDSHLPQFAALAALERLDLLPPELQNRLDELGDDPEWHSIKEYIGE